MTGDDFGRLIYLVLLAAVIGGYFLVSNRKKLGETARQAALWAFIFLGIIVVYGLWSDVRDTVFSVQTVSAETGMIEVPRGADGHYYLTLQIDGVGVEFVVDTGASEVVLSMKDAKRVGIDTASLIFSGVAKTANGNVRTARVRLEDVRLGDIKQGSLRASVNEGDMDISLLGMSYLQRFNRVEITHGKLVLER